jgi:hypothetical protein
MKESKMHSHLSPLAYWTFLRRFLRGLLTWGSSSIVGGVTLALLVKSDFWKQFGWQQAGWGAVDAALAVAGWQNVEKNYAAARAETWDGDVHQEANRLWWILMVNGVLDALYIAGGAWLMRQPSEKRQGMGAGIIVQGGFLLLWDIANALIVGRWFQQNTDAKTEGATSPPSVKE